MKLLSEFDSFPVEKSLIGEMLMAYGEIEFILMRLMGVYFKENDADDTALRVLFRVKGESARIDVADAILRPALAKYRLDGKWGNALGASRLCKDIRNQYAHCHWYYDDKRGLCFLNLDMDASTVETATIHPQPIDQALIEQQHRFFRYTTDLLYFVDYQFRKKAGLKPTRVFSEPKSVPIPPKSNQKKLADPGPPKARKT